MDKLLNGRVVPSSNGQVREEKVSKPIKAGPYVGRLPFWFNNEMDRELANALKQGFHKPPIEFFEYGLEVRRGHLIVAAVSCCLAMNVGTEAVARLSISSQ